MKGPGNLPEGVSDNSVESEILSDNNPQDLSSGNPVEKRGQFNRGAYEDDVKKEEAFQEHMKHFQAQAALEPDEDD